MRKTTLMAVAALSGATATLPVLADSPTPVIRVDASGGSDAGDGSAAKPFATIERAKQETARLKKRPDFAGVTVELEGVFDFPKGGVWLLKDDGGRPGAPVEWRAGPRGATVTGSQRIKASDFRPVADPRVLARLRPAARGQVKALDLRARGIELKKLGDQFVAWNDCELYASDGAKPLARYPNDGWLTMAKIVDRGVAAIDMSKGIEFNKGVRGGTFEYAPDEAFDRWSVADGVWLYGYFCMDWYGEAVRVARIDRTKRQVTLAGVPKYGVGTPASWEPFDNPHRRYYAFNLLEELDTPGEWCVDREKGVLYYWPTDGGDVLFSARPREMWSMLEATDVTVRGIRFCCAAGASAVKALKCERVSFVDCTFERTLRDGLIVQGGRNVTVSGCTFREIGATAVSLDGGDRRTLTPAGHRLVGCEIHHTSRMSRMASGVSVGGVGQTVSGCRLHDFPYIALRYWGNENLIESNEVWCAMLEGGDGGAIYTGRDWGSQGNVVRGNSIHHLGVAGSRWRAEHGLPVELKALTKDREAQTMGLYLDDCDAGDTVVGNTFEETGYGVFVGGGRDNLIHSNRVIRCHSAYHLDTRGLERARPGKNIPGDSWDLLAKIAPYKPAESPWKDRYPQLVNVMDEEPLLPLHTEFVGNVAEDCTRFFSHHNTNTCAVLKRLRIEGNRFFGKPDGHDLEDYPQDDPKARRRVEIRRNAAVGIRPLRVVPNKIVYEEGETGTVEVVVRCCEGAGLQGCEVAELRVEEKWGLEGEGRELWRGQVSLTNGETRTLTIPYPGSTVRYGHEVRVTVPAASSPRGVVTGNASASASQRGRCGYDISRSEFFNVNTDWWRVNQGLDVDLPRGQPSAQTRHLCRYYGFPEEELKGDFAGFYQGDVYARRMPGWGPFLGYGNMFMRWHVSECSVGGNYHPTTYPQQKRWINSQGTWRCNADINRDTRLCHARGVKQMHFSINLMEGPGGIEMGRRRPEWVLRNARGQFEGNYGTSDPAKLADNTQQYIHWTYLVPDFMRDDCFEWAIEDLKRGVEAFDEDGVYFDGRYLPRNGYDWEGRRSVDGYACADSGKSLAQNEVLRERIIRSIRRTQEMLVGPDGRKRYIWSSDQPRPESPCTATFNHPQVGALTEIQWEFLKTPSMPVSSYRGFLDFMLPGRNRCYIPSKYAPNPSRIFSVGFLSPAWCPCKKGADFARDQWTMCNHVMAELVSMLAHPIAGGVSMRNYKQMLTRYSELFWHEDIEILRDGYKRFLADSLREIWYDDMIYRRVAKDHVDYYIHLVNTPERDVCDDTVEEDPLDVDDVEVSTKILTGKARAWAIRPYDYMPERYEPVCTEVKPKIVKGETVFAVPPFKYYTLLVIREPK